jgi:predicted metal-dependent hydrolase
MKIEVRRSTRRIRTISANLVGDRIIVQIPAAMSKSDEAFWVERMKKRLLDRKNRHDEQKQEDLTSLADEINARYFQGRALYHSINYTEKQKSIFGSCSVRSRTIRISSRVRAFPSWVLTYVVLHELAHLLHADHSKRFWALVKQYPLADKARGFLTGYAYGRRAARK